MPPVKVNAAVRLHVSAAAARAGCNNAPADRWRPLVNLEIPLAHAHFLVALFLSPPFPLYLVSLLFLPFPLRVSFTPPRYTRITHARVNAYTA